MGYSGKNSSERFTWFVLSRHTDVCSTSEELKMLANLSNMAVRKLRSRLSSQLLICTPAIPSFGDESRNRVANQRSTLTDSLNRRKM